MKRTSLAPPINWQEAGPVPLALGCELQGAYRAGHLTAIVTLDFGEWHLSIAHARRYPSWDEIADARYAFCPNDITMAMLLPPADQYVNLHDFCFHLHEIEQ